MFSMSAFKDFMFGLLILALLPVAALTFPDESLLAFDSGSDDDLSPLFSTRVLAPDSIVGAPYYRILLRRPGDPRGPALGAAWVAFPETPFNVAVNRSGHYVYDLFISVDRPRPQEGTAYVAWVATPGLERMDRVGMVEPGEILQHRVDFDNKFLVFISEEPDADVREVSGRIVLRGTSRSGRMESMFSHGFCPPDVQC